MLMNRIVKLMRCVVFAAALYAGSLSAQQVTPAMIQRAKAMGATQEQIDAALAERNELSGRPSSTQAQGSEVASLGPGQATRIRGKAANLTAVPIPQRSVTIMLRAVRKRVVPVFRSRGDTRCARTPIR